MATTMNASGMLKYESIAENLTIDAWGTVTNSSGKAILYGARGIYSDTLAFAGMVNTTASRIHANDLELSLANGNTITVKNYFLYNGGTSFNYVVGADDTTTNLIDAGFIENRNKYNEYNLTEKHDTESPITKTYIQGTAFNDTVDLSDFDSDQLKYSNGYPISQIVVNTERGNDTITGSIVNDYIIGGSGENTLKYDTFIANNQSFGTDTYALTYKEDVNIEFGDELMEGQVITEKAGNDIHVNVFAQKAQTQFIAYEKTVASSDQIATVYKKVVTEGDTTATKYEKYEVIANDTAETEGEHEGKFEKVTKLYVRNADNTDWEEAADQPESEWEDEAVAADTKYIKSVNGIAGEATDTEPENFDDEGKFNKTVKVFSRNDSNDDWNTEADTTTPSLEDAAITPSEVVKKSVNGEDAEVYTGEDFSDEGKFNKTSIVYDYNGVRDLTQADIANSDLTLVDNSTVSKAIETTDLTEELKTGNYTVNKEGKLYHEAEYRDVVQGDLVDGLTLIDNTNVKKAVETTDLTTELQEGGYTVQDGKLHKDGEEDRDLTQEDLADGLTLLDDKVNLSRELASADFTEEAVAEKFISGSGIETFAEVNRDLEQADLATGWTIAEDKINATRTLGAADLTEAAQAYERETGTGKLVLWDKNNEKSGTSIIDDAIAPASDYKKYVTVEGITTETVYTWNNESKPTDMGTSETGVILVDQDTLLGKIILPYIGASNDYASVSIDGTDIFDNTFYINAQYGGYIAGMRADEEVELGQYPATFVAQTTGKNGFDTFYSNASTAPQLIYANYQYKLQDIVADYNTATDNIDGDTENKNFEFSTTYYDGSIEGVSFNNVDVTYIDKSGAGYKVDIIDNDKDYSTQWSHNMVYAEAAEEGAGVSVNTGVLNDVVVFGSEASGENINKVTYRGGNDAYLGSEGKEEYDIATMNWSTNLTINDLGGDADLIKFTDTDFSDMTIFFDVNKYGEAGNSGLTFVSNDIVKSGNPYYTLSFLQGNTTGGVIVENFFNKGQAILDGDNVQAGVKGAGYIEQVKLAGNSSAGSIDAQIAQITQNVEAWLTNNANYDSAMEVVDAGNANDIQSLMQCYTAGTTSVVA